MEGRKEMQENLDIDLGEEKERKDLHHKQGTRVVDGSVCKIFTTQV